MQLVTHKYVIECYGWTFQLFNYARYHATYTNRYILQRNEAKTKCSFQKQRKRNKERSRRERKTKVCVCQNENSNNVKFHIVFALANANSAYQHSHCTSLNRPHTHTQSTPWNFPFIHHQPNETRLKHHFYLSFFLLHYFIPHEMSMSVWVVLCLDTTHTHNLCAIVKRMKTQHLVENMSDVCGRFIHKLNFPFVCNRRFRPVSVDTLTSERDLMPIELNNKQAYR